MEKERTLYQLDARRKTYQAQRRRTAQSYVREFDEKLDTSWIFHDNALEGVVISYVELKAAVDKRIISDVSLIPMYEEINCHKNAIEWVRQLADEQPTRKKRGPITLDTIRQLHGILSPGDGSKGAPYRKDNPLHRLYFHEIAPPDKIVSRMKKLVEWIEDDEARMMHPVERAARAHCRMMSVYPWNKNTGKTARLLMNLLLLRDGYPPAIIHSIERQRYYDALRSETTGVVPLVVESVTNAVETGIRFFEELRAARRQSRKAS